MLIVEALTKRFQDTYAVDDLSFEARPGEIVALLGPNGAGKSTTLLCMSGLIRPDSGSFSWNGALLGARRARTLALIPETPVLYEALTVWEHLVFTTQSCNVAAGWQQCAEVLLERFALVDYRDKLGGELSKGMKQKTLIVATLLVDAPVLLVDEPMIGLDPAAQRELREELLRLRSDGKVVIVSTHMLDIAESIGDRALILKRGRCVFCGSLRDLPAHGAESLEGAFLRVTA